MNTLLELPLGYRLAAVGVIGLVLGHLANLAAYTFSENRGRNPWSQEHPRDQKNRWLDRLPLIGWLRLSRKTAELGRGFWLRALVVEMAMAGLCAGLYWWEIDQWGILPPGIVGTHVEIPPAPGDQQPDASSGQPNDVGETKGAADSGDDGDERPKITRPLVPPSRITWQILHVVYASNVLLIALMLAATLIDLDERIIPDEITVPGTLAGLALAAGYAWSLMPVGVSYKFPPGIQFVEFMTLAFPVCEYPREWPLYLEGRDQLLPLLVALAVYGFWCVSLLPWLWRPRRGFDHATRMLVAYAMRSPNALSVLLMALCGGAGIGVVWWLGGPNWTALLTSLAGLAMGGGLIWMVRLVGALALRREAMGFGDVTLMAMIGVFLGWQACVIIFFLAPILGLVIGGARWAMGRGREIPYGPFLCLATLIVIVGWRWVWDRFSYAFEPLYRLPALLLVGFVLMFIMLSLWQLVANLSHRKSSPSENSSMSP